MDIIIRGKYFLEEKIGRGSFGVIWKAINIYTEEKVAIKFEDKDDNSLLKREAILIKYLKGIKGIPNIRNYGSFEGKNYMVMDLLDYSLENLKRKYGKFTLKTIVQLGCEIIDILSAMHKRGIIHRDIKPDNFLLNKSKNRVYLIDFGLARQYITTDGEHKPIRYNRKLLGTVRYISKHCHNGIEPSRRDDLISVCYMLIYFLRTTLPWQGIQAKNKFEKIHTIKTSITNIELCQGLPAGFREILTYCEELSYDINPDYEYIKTILRKECVKKKVEMDGEYEWAKKT